jgi:hypothetical protein
VAFEKGSPLERNEEYAFSWSALKSIEIPSSVIGLGEQGFFDCEPLESVTFEIGSRLERIDRSIFACSGVNLELVSQRLRRTTRMGGIGVRSKRTLITTALGVHSKLVTK